MASSNHSNNDPASIQSIASTAISHIQQLVSLVEQRPTAASTSSNELQVATPRAGTALEELRRRFPTVSARSSRNAATGRYERSNTFRPYPNVRRTVGRPLTSETVSKDIVILDFGREKIPTKSEKAELERSGRIISGFDINRKWDAKTLHNEISRLLPGYMEGLYFEIVKNSGGTLIRPNLPAGKDIDAKLLLKSIAPSGWVYLRLLEELPDSFMDPSDKKLFVSPFAVEDTGDPGDPGLCIDLTDTPDGERLCRQNSANGTESSNPDESSTLNANESQSQSSSLNINSIIRGAKEGQLSDPVEVLKYLQKEIVTRRPLEVTSSEDTIEGETNYIIVDRDNILETTFAELQYISNYRLTFQVDFMGEECVDYGGPRTEWIRLMNQAIKQKYFDHGLRPLLAEDYFNVGIMMAIAMLQNGQLPLFVEEDILQQIVSEGVCLDPCVAKLQHGIEVLGMLSALQELPMLIHLLRPQGQQKLGVQMLLHILKPQFSEEGSNALKKEKEVYQLFVRYVREVAASRRVCGKTTLNLSHILQFATGSPEEPVLGFTLAPSLEFILPTELKVTSQQGLSEGQNPNVEGGFLPLAHTCTNLLQVPRPTDALPLPSTQRLFALYDLAFSQCYFGKK
ncbi:unnamed protein product [Porites lobata]|uniref:HECT-type E3 ubiquitin transferase n=1 Tax=Porites lobata TaxID=104759 RepID=A0ABN8PYY3_9CNID|nr:unnamed protein product [Porites lobata]